MKIDPRSLIAPIFAVLVLVLVVQNTAGALKASGTWQPEAKNRVRPESPYARLDLILSRAGAAPLPEAIRDPFGYGGATPRVSATPSTPRRVTETKPAAPVEPPRPSLTSIIWDDDPRATVRWDGRDFSVRANSLFADFTVKSIRPTEVVLERGGQQMVLRLIKKGD